MVLVGSLDPQEHVNLKIVDTNSLKRVQVINKFASWVTYGQAWMGCPSCQSLNAGDKYCVIVLHRQTHQSLKHQLLLPGRALLHPIQSLGFLDLLNYSQIFKFVSQSLFIMILLFLRLDWRGGQSIWPLGFWKTLIGTPVPSSEQRIWELHGMVLNHVDANFRMSRPFRLLATLIPGLPLLACVPFVDIGWPLPPDLYSC